MSRFYGDSLVIISYNHDFDIPTNESRRQFYTVSLPDEPIVCFDGTDRVFEPNPAAYYTTFNQHIQAAKSVVPSYNLKLSGNATVSNGQLQIKILPADTLQRDSVAAFVAICEDGVRGNLGGSFNYVIRQFYAFPANISYPDSIDTTVTFSHSIPINLMSGVLFVQDLNSKKVLQATKTEFGRK